MDKYAKSTAIISIILTVLIITWDIFLALDGRVGNTISEVVRTFARNNKWFAYLLVGAFGGLTTHFFKTTQWCEFYWYILTFVCCLVVAYILKI